MGKKHSLKCAICELVFLQLTDTNHIVQNAKIVCEYCLTRLAQKYAKLLQDKTKRSILGGGG